MILLVFPHQLFADHPGLSFQPERVVLLEDSLFFGDDRYPVKFHKQKLWLHRASMKRYAMVLEQDGHKVDYVEYDHGTSSLKRSLSTIVKEAGTREVRCLDPVDFVLKRRIEHSCRALHLHCKWLANPGFLNTTEENQAYRDQKSRWFMADFYKWQRRRMGILMEGDQPLGGQWSFDDENRKKVPKKLLDQIPSVLVIQRDTTDLEAKDYIETKFPSHPGRLDDLFYPTSHRDAARWLQHFLEQRLVRFGDYEDAIVEKQSWLWHSILTPALNIGLLTPKQVVQETQAFADRQSVPINSLEGFLRQVIGWREFMRATYEDLGVRMRTTNHWEHHRRMPECLYRGTTGILPIDDVIQRLVRTGYCHHIERLMVLGGFMFLCEIDPDEIYQWFMEMFVDSYDWVMVPNVYAMSQNADGGNITTKPYFSGSSYVRKMSHHRPGAWCEIWDGLYWRWIWNHVEELGKNPRWAMMCSMAKKMDSAKRDRHLANAESFLRKLDENAL